MAILAPSWRHGLVAATVALHGCAAAPRGPMGPVVSPTGIVYELGTPPVPTRFSRTAALYLSRGLLDRALQFAQDGVAADPANPVHYFLAGLAYARLTDYDEADRMFTEAQRIYPAYELDIEPEREAAWAVAYNEAVEFYANGNLDEAMKAWSHAATIYDLRPEALRNLAGLLVGQEKYDEAIRAYQRALLGLQRKPATHVLTADEVQTRDELAVSTEASLLQIHLFMNRYAEAEPLLRRQLLRDSTNVQLRSDLGTALRGLGREAEAGEVYSALLADPRVRAAELSNLGVTLFRAADFGRASQAFERLTTLRPNSRDVWFNYANALYAAEAWAALATVGDRLVELDPLGRKVGLIAARAHLEADNEEAARRGLERIDSAPVYVEELQMMPFESVTRIQGRILGNHAEAGRPVRLRFTFYDDAEPLGSETVTVAAPSPGDSKALEVSFAMRATGYRYGVIP